MSIILHDLPDWYFLDPLPSLLIAVLYCSVSLYLSFGIISKIFLDHVPTISIWVALSGLDNVRKLFARSTFGQQDGIDKLRHIDSLFA